MPNGRGAAACSIASGLIVGESLVGVAMAAIIGGSGNPAPLALVGEGFAPAAAWIGLAVFALVAAGFAKRTLTGGRTMKINTTAGTITGGRPRPHPHP